MAKRAIAATYSGTGLPRQGAYGRLWRYVRCQRHPAARRVARAYWARQHAAWAARRHPVAYTALASWYYDGGSTASGFHAYYGVANKVLAFGTRVVISYHGREVTATVDDRGPYVGAREWDLNQNTARALGFGGVGYVTTSVPGA